MNVSGIGSGNCHNASENWNCVILSSLFWNIVQTKSQRKEPKAKERNALVLKLIVFVTTCKSRYAGTVCDSVCLAVLLPPRSIFVEVRPPALGPCAPCYERPDTICLKKAI